MNQELVKQIKSYHNTIAESPFKNSLSSTLSKFEKVELPTTKNENWLYTNFKNILNSPIDSETSSDELQSDLSNYLITPDSVLYIVNGSMDLKNSKLPKGVRLDSNNDQSFPVNASEDKDPAPSLLAQSILKEYLSIHISKEVSSSPLTIVHYNTRESLTSSHISFTVDEHVEFNCLELFLSSEAELSHSSFSQTSFDLKRNAHVEHVKANLQGSMATHHGTVSGQVSRDSELRAFTFTIGSKVSRNNIQVKLQEENSTIHAHGLYTLNTEEHCDNFSDIHHTVGHTNSHQFFKGILSDKSRGIFTGKINIHKGASQSDSSQLNKNLLLSTKAHVDTRPQLEVYNDDVSAAHGATIGQLDPDEIFYLASRCLSAEKAQTILCNAFANESLENVKNNEIRHFLQKNLNKKLEKMLNEINV